MLKYLSKILAEHDIFKILGIGVLVLGIIFLLFNWDYFYTQIKFRLTAPNTNQTEESSEQANLLEPNTIFIPSLQITAPIKFVTENNEPVFQKALQDGVVHYPQTALVGEAGNSYIFGHSSDFAFSKGDFKTVFALLPQIELGAIIFATNSSGQQFEYQVIDKFVAKKTDTHLLNQDTGGKTILTLQTSYPIGTALQRYIVVSELILEKPLK